MNKSKILIYGAGGHARVLKAAITQGGRYEVAGFVVDDDARVDSQSIGPVIRYNELESSRRYLPRQFIVGIGDNAARRMRTEAMESLGFEPTTIIHPYTHLADEVCMGRGVYVGAGVILDPDVCIGDGVILNVNCGVGHGARIGHFSHIGPGVLYGANSPLGEESFIGMGAIVISGVGVGSRSLVSAGALINKDVPDDVLAVGSPARFRSRHVADDSAAMATSGAQESR